MRVQYIAKNNELAQEFHYAHPSTNVFANKIFNTHFTVHLCGSLPKLTETWNTSHRLMLSLPLRTHRNLVEPLNGSPHIINSLWKYI